MVEEHLQPVGEEEGHGAIGGGLGAVVRQALWGDSSRQWKRT